MMFVIGKPVAALNLGLTEWLHSLSGGNVLLLGAVLGCFRITRPWWSGK